MGKIKQQILEYKRRNPDHWQAAVTQWFLQEIQKQQSPLFQEVTPSQIQPGKFYFLFYDIPQNLKSSRMEQFAPCLCVKIARIENKPVCWILNWNFIPERVRIEWFDQIVSRFFSSIYEQNLERAEIRDQRAWPLTFEGVYRTLASIGFEYAIREIRLDVINRALLINQQELARFLSYDTETLSGVDPKRLVEIWSAKLGEGPERLRELRLNIIHDFKVLNLELQQSMQRIKMVQANL